MRRLVAAMKKEMLLLVRDKIGLAILFLMPMVLIFVMTLIQDSAFRTINEEGIPIVFVNEDQDTLGQRIEQGLRNAELCSFEDEIDGRKATRKTAKKAVKEGRFLVGIIIPEGTTQAIKNNVENIVLESIGSYDETKNDELSVEILLIIDPVASKSFVISITSQLREFISSVKMRLMFETFNAQITELIPDDLDNSKNVNVDHQVIRYKQEYASELTGQMRPNAVQHNVPAWTIFGMFFIVIPLVGSILKEKTEGSVFRFHTIPASYLLQINAKVLVYICVCMLQFVLMLSIGLVFLPMLGLPVLQLGNSYMGVLLVAIGCSAAAAGFGVLVGTLAKTPQQGAILGSLSILLLSAIGGIWVPSYIMPEIMRIISRLSPLNWGLDGFYALFLRGEGLLEILPQFIKLFVFFALCLMLAVLVHKMKKRG
jgi:ABC-2 type transport system permease protein